MIWKFEGADTFGEKLSQNVDLSLFYRRSNQNRELQQVLRIQGPRGDLYIY